MPELIAHCMTCEKQLTGKEGVIHISYQVVDKAAAAKLAWKQEQDTLKAEAKARGSLHFLTPSDLDKIPNDAGWLVHCNNCNPHYNGDGDLCGNCYWFDVERCTTWIELMEWTRHLSEKDWLADTNWLEFIGDIPNNKKRRLVVGQP